MGATDVWYAVAPRTADPTVPLDYPQDFTLTYTSTCDLVTTITVSDTTTLAVDTPDLDVDIPPAIISKATGTVDISVDITNNGEDTFARDGTALVTIGNGWDITAGLPAFAGTQLFPGGDYQWVQSTDNTDEYYVVKLGGGDPGLFAPTDVLLGGISLLGGSGAPGSLTAAKWGWGDVDTLGFNTIYVNVGGVPANITATVPAVTTPPVVADTRILVADLTAIPSG
ncbi:MAG: hypothetical protein EOM52_13015, partial [Clostridia bacterium]|nr:hypothetical protein [Clostridia bacterium]